MTINEGQYCHVDTSGVDFVDQGPQRLPQNWQQSDGSWYYNINNSDLWPDPQLATIDWLPYVEIDAGEPQDGKSYNRTLSDFVIEATRVTRTAIYTEWTQAEYDLRADTTRTDSQRVAADLARQTDAHLREDDLRIASGRTPLIPTVDRADVEQYLGSLYDAVDDPANSVQEPPGATRQITVVPGEARDRGVIRRRLQQDGGFDYWEIEYTFYTDLDATGMSLWIEKSDGTYLFTMPLVDQGDGVWFATTDKTAGMANVTGYSVALFKGQKISQLIELPNAETESDKYPLYFDVRWLNGATLQSRIDRGEISFPGNGRGRGPLV